MFALEIRYRRPRISAAELAREQKILLTEFKFSSRNMTERSRAPLNTRVQLSDAGSL